MPIKQTAEVIPAVEAAERLAGTLIDASRNAAALMMACPEHEGELRQAGKEMASAARRIVAVMEALAGVQRGEVH